MCLWCRRFDIETWSCAAFPERVPGALTMGGADHRAPLPGDGGLRFEPKNREARLEVEQRWGETPVRYVGELNPFDPSAPTALEAFEEEPAENI